MDITGRLGENRGRNRGKKDENHGIQVKKTELGRKIRQKSKWMTYERRQCCKDKIVVNLQVLQ